MNNEKNAGYALPAGEGRVIYFRGTKMTVKVSGEASDGAYSLIEMLHPPGVGPALHRHPTSAGSILCIGWRVHDSLRRGCLYGQHG